jgi:Ankyrin repeats (3 copies)
LKDCRAVAKVIKDTFDSIHCDEEFYYLSNRTTMVSDEFGSPVLRDPEQTPEGPEETFSNWLDCFEAAEGPLDPVKISDLKRDIIANSRLFSLFDPLASGPCNLLQHAAIGKAADADLVHWMACMGALDYEHIDGSWRGAIADIGGQYYRSCVGMKTLHRAIVANKLEAVYTILEFDNTRDINLKTADRVGDTPLHLALRYGHSEIAFYLFERFVDVLGELISFGDT